MALLAPFTGGVADHGTSMVMGNDYTAWVAHPADHMVVQYDLRGRVVRRFISESDAPRPVAVAVPENRGEVLVGDAATARVLVFDPVGTLRGRLGGRSPGAAASRRWRSVRRACTSWTAARSRWWSWTATAGRWT